MNVLVTFLDGQKMTSKPTIIIKNSTDIYIVIMLDGDDVKVVIMMFVAEYH